MKTKIMLICLIGLLLGAMGGAAQEEERPEVAAATIYDFFLSANAEDFPLLGAYICTSYNYWNETRFQILVQGRDGEAINLDGVTFSVSYVADNNSFALIDLEGDVTSEAFVQLPQHIRMVNDGGWKICQEDRPSRIISPSDLALTEDDARTAAIQFYAAFYGNRSEVLDAVVCERKREAVKAAAAEYYGAAHEILATSQWDLRFAPDGYALEVLTEGTLELKRIDDGAVLAVPDREDFRTPRLIRENGWKFCTGYREAETLIQQFVEGYYGVPNETWPNLICPSYRSILVSMGEASSIDIASVNLPSDLFQDENVNDRLANGTNMQAVVILGTGGEAISTGQEFGLTAQLVQTRDGAWQWCQLPPSFIQNRSER